MEKDQARDFEVHEYEAMRDIVKPTFKHEISTVVQVKDKKSGSLGGTGTAASMSCGTSTTAK